MYFTETPSLREIEKAMKMIPNFTPRGHGVVILCKHEFIEKAVNFYIGYLTSEDNKSFLPSIVTSTLKSIVAESDNRTSRILFKIAVELAILQNIVAATNEIDDVSLKRLRGECVKEVTRLKGSLDFDDALDWQKG